MSFEFIEILNKDLILEIIYKFDNIDPILNFSICNKNLFSLIDEDAFWNWGKIKYTYDFWRRALNRSYDVSYPLNSMKKELIRIHKFQENMKKAGQNEWNNEDFYRYWQCLEKIREHKYNKSLASLSNKQIYDALNLL